MELKTDIFSILDKGWALLSAGNMDSYNSMTVSWGALGTIWGKPAATVYVRHSRYTHEFMDTNDIFTLSFFPEEYKPDLTILGRKSGRDGDKMAETKLTPKALTEGVGFEEASITLVCRKKMCQELESKNLMPEIADTFYSDQDFHTMYIGEVLEVIEK